MGEAADLWGTHTPAPTYLAAGGEGLADGVLVDVPAQVPNEHGRAPLRLLARAAPLLLPRVAGIGLLLVLAHADPAARVACCVVGGWLVGCGRIRMQVTEKIGLVDHQPSTIACVGVSKAGVGRHGTVPKQKKNAPKVASLSSTALLTPSAEAKTMKAVPDARPSRMGRSTCCLLVD